MADSPVRPASEGTFTYGTFAQFTAGADYVRDALVALIRKDPNFAIDIETYGLGVDSRRIKSICFAHADHAVILDPRDPAQAHLARMAFKNAKSLTFHSSTFDVPALYAAWLMSIDDVSKVWDTLIWARLADPGEHGGNGLEACAVRMLGATKTNTLTETFRTYGYTKSAGFHAFDLDRPVYLAGAVSDGLVTAALRPAVRVRAMRTTTQDHPFTRWGVTGAEAERLVDREQVINRMLLRRACRGLRVDFDFLDDYRDRTAITVMEAAAALERAGIRPGVGGDLAKVLEELGEMPADHPRTPKTGAYQMTAKLVDRLNHPLARQFVEHKKIVKVLNDYLVKVRDLADSEGRIHPVCSMLAAVTGRSCLPDNHRLLTSRGVIRVEEIRKGDRTISENGEWTVVQSVHRYSDQPIKVWKSGARNLLKLECTEEHRWVQHSEKRGFRHIQPISSSRHYVQLAPRTARLNRTISTIDAVTDRERFAALVGMLITDGRVSVGGYGVGMRAYLYQTEGKFHAEMLRVIPEQAVMYDRKTLPSRMREGGKLTDDCHEIRLKTRWLHPRLNSEGLSVRPGETLAQSDSLTTWVLGLSERESLAFMQAVWLCDGPTAHPSNGAIPCEWPAAREAIQIAAYRAGMISRVFNHGRGELSTKDCLGVYIRDSTINTRYLRESDSRSDVWCVTTDSGTFTAWSPDGGPYLTGNSMSDPPLQQFPAGARGIILADEGDTLVSIDWSQIEPVVMANIAGEQKVLDGYENGTSDVYTDVATLAGGIDRKTAKVVLLAQMYGEGIKKLAADLGITQDEAKELKAGIFRAMPRARDLMQKWRNIGEEHQKIFTLSGRIVPIPMGEWEGRWSVQTHKAINFACQGSAYDVLAETLVSVEEAGLGDAVSLCVHDELVVSQDAAHDIQKIMETPPPRLCELAGRTPVLRTDLAVLGDRWGSG